MKRLLAAALIASPAAADELIINSFDRSAPPFGHAHLYVVLDLDAPAEQVFIECFLKDAHGRVTADAIEAAYQVEGERIVKLVFTDPGEAVSASCEASF